MLKKTKSNFTMDGWKFVLLVFSLGLIKSGLIKSDDQSFTIAYMDNFGNYDDRRCDNGLVLYIAAVSETTNCSISAPKFAPFTTIDVVTSDVVELKLPRQLALDGSRVEQKGIAVSCNNLVTVYGINPCKDNTGGFSVIPNSHLGTEHYAFSVEPSYSYYSQIAVVSNLDDTNVTLHLPSFSTCHLTIDGTQLLSGSPTNQQLNAYESLQIQSKCNLAGTYITSNNPVAVFSGNDRSSVNNSSPEHLVTQILPLKGWGKQFVAVPTLQKGLSLYIMTGTNETHVNISCTSTIPTSTTLVIEAGSIFDYNLPFDEYCFVETNQPTFLVQAIGNQPSLLPLTSIDQYSANYSFITPKASDGGDFDNYLTFVIEETANSYWIYDSHVIPIEETYHKKIPGTNLIGGYIRMENGLHQLNHPCVNFNAVLFGFSGGESYAISLGWNWKIANQTFDITHQRPTSTEGSTNQMSTTFRETTYRRPTSTEGTSYEMSTKFRETTHPRPISTLSATYQMSTSVESNTGPEFSLPEQTSTTCPYPTKTTKWTEILLGNKTKEELVKLVKEDFEKNIKVNIMINPQNVSRIIRMRSSAKNMKVTEEYVGLGISWIVLVPIVFAVTSDLINFLRFCCEKKGVGERNT